MSFGADTDYWGFAKTNIKLISSSASPNKSEAQCVDSYGDVDASTMYDSFTDYSCVYGICGAQTLVLYDTTTSVDFRLGKVISGKVITSQELSTENTAQPTLTISGRSTTSLDATVQKYIIDELEAAVSRKATPFGFAADSKTRVTGSSISATVSTAILLDSQGVEACLDVYGGRVEASNDLVGCSGDVGGAATSGWTLSSGPSMDQENTGYATGSATVFKNIARDS